MAKVSFNAAMSTTATRESSGNSVGFFSLKNDGDEAIVRIMHDSVEDFDIVTLHPITLGGKYRSVSCIRDAREPMDNCPLCSSGAKIMSKIFIHMIQYTTDANGQIEAKPVVWERSISYATKLKNDIDEYGPLSNCIFKIKRNGKAGDMQTTYEMKLGNPNMYNESSYPKLEGVFDNYSACGTVVLDKNYDEIATYVATGNFPDSKKSDSNQNDTPEVSSNPNVNTSRPNWNNNSGNDTPFANGFNGSTTGSAPNRPTRYY